MRANNKLIKYYILNIFFITFRIKNENVNDKKVSVIYNTSFAAWVHSKRNITSFCYIYVLFKDKTAL